MIKPTIGRVVWFHPGRDFPGTVIDDQPLAALVAHVWGDRCVNLQVADSNGVAHSQTSVELVQDGGTIPGTGRYCEWMPFQKGQAAKTEALEAAANPPGCGMHGMTPA
jgi:hypothetical protein